MMSNPDKLFTAKYTMSLLATKDILKFADAKLCDGVYSEHYLSIIDANPKNWAEVSPLFELAMNESGVGIPSIDEAVWILLRHHINIIATETVNPISQFGELLQDIERFDLYNGIKKYVGDNVGIHYMYGWYHEIEDFEQESNDEIIKECKKWLGINAEKH